MTTIDLETLAALEKLSVEVRVSGNLRRAAFIEVLRRRAGLRLDQAAQSFAVDTLPREDIV